MIIKHGRHICLRCAKVCGPFFPLLCFSGSDWLSRQTPITWLFSREVNSLSFNSMYALHITPKKCLLSLPHPWKIQTGQWGFSLGSRTQSRFDQTTHQPLSETVRGITIFMTCILKTHSTQVRLPVYHMLLWVKNFQVRHAVAVPHKLNFKKRHRKPGHMS